MTEASKARPTPDVPAMVFEKFLADPIAAGLPEDVVARLRKALVEERSFGDRALKAAVLSEEPLP